MKLKTPWLRCPTWILSVGGALLAFAQAPDGPPPPGPGGPGFGRPFGGPMQEEVKLVKRFDKDGDQRLNATERKAAREFLAQERANRGNDGPRDFRFGGRGRSEEPPKPGPKVSPSEVKTFPGAHLYDPETLRTLFLQFEDTDWEQELSDFKNTDVEVPARLVVDGKTYEDIGVRFRGMSSFGMVGEGHKRSFNLSLDFVHHDQQIDGYRTLNLLNSHEDPSFLRAVLFLDVAREYLPAAKANFARVVINGESWGVYSSVQQFNKDFVKDWFNTTKGARWKVPGSPMGRGSLAYLGDNPEAYKRIYEIKSKDDSKSWTDLIRLCRVLNETPPGKLEEALAPLLDIDGALKFLALENALINNDGYWIRTSDYSIYQDEKGRFHILPSDANETFSLPGGPGFGGGRGGPGGVGPGMMLSNQILAQADKDGDRQLSKAEFVALGDAWFDKLDPDKTGQVGRDPFLSNLGEVLPLPQGFGPRNAGGPGGGRGGPGGFGPAAFLGPGLFTALDADKNDSLTREEVKGTFEKWAREWSQGKEDGVSEEKLRAGLDAVLPRPNLRGPGGAPPPPSPGQAGPGPGPGGAGRINGVELDPLFAQNDSNKPLISKLLAVPALRTRYLGYVHDIAEKWLDWKRLGPIAQKYHDLIAADVEQDTRKLDSTEDFVRNLNENVGGNRGPGGGGPGPFGGRETIGLKTFAEKRQAYLLNYKEKESK